MSPAQTSSGEVTREAIIKAAFDLFVQQGYHGTSMRDIAAGAGITAGSIYNHFSDKTKIFQAVILAYHPIVVVLPHLQQAEGQSAEALIRDAARRMAESIQANPGIVKLFATELVEMNGKNLSFLVTTILPDTQAFLMRLYSTGEIARPPQPLQFFRAFLGMMISYAVTSLVFESLPEVKAMDQPMDEYIEIFLWGVLGQPPKRTQPGAV